jgi:hypothetical protein
VAAVLLLGVGCFNREHGSAEAASVGSPSNSEAAQSAASSAGKQLLYEPPGRIPIWNR